MLHLLLEFSIFFSSETLEFLGQILQLFFGVLYSGHVKEVLRLKRLKFVLELSWIVEGKSLTIEIISHVDQVDIK